MSDMRRHLRTRHHTEQAILQFPEADQEGVTHDVSGFSNAMKAVASENEVATQVTVDLFLFLLFLYTEEHVCKLRISLHLYIVLF